MKFTCSSGALIDALQIVTKALPSRTTNPILEGILIETDMNEIILTCSDERIAIVTRFEAYVTEPGRGIVPGKLFSEIVRRLTDGDIAIDMNDRFVFTIRGSGNRTNISGQDADLFPALPKLSEEREIALPQDMLKDMIQKTEFAIAVEDMREVLTGALLEIEGGDVTMVALDGFRMALKRAKCGEVVERLTGIIPGRVVGDIGKLLSSDPEAFASLSFDYYNKLHIKLDKTEIYVILIEGEYVQYKVILPPTFSTNVIVDLEPFRRCIDRAALIAREGNNNLLILKIAGGEMAIEAHSQIGDVYEKLDVQQDGLDINIAFNVKYLTDVVRFIDAEQIEIKLNLPIAPVVISPVGDPDYIHLVLPVRTGATK